MQRPLILVADDYPDSREMLAEYLRFEGFDVEVASDGAEAIRIAERRHPAVILMDLSMPILDGWEATRRLKADKQMSDVRVVALTAHALKHEQQAAFSAGCDGFITKPVDLPSLAETLRRLVNAPKLGGARTVRGSSRLRSV